MAKVLFKGVTKRFAEFTAVNRVDLQVEDGEFMVLVGPSGCGKTTLLRMAAGLEEITEGELYIGERLVNNVSPKDRDIAMVFQNYALYPHMDVYNNMAFGLKLRKTPKEEIRKRVHAAAELLDLNDKLRNKPRQLSGGQRQRVAVGRAIVRYPQVFLFDEPLSNLDAKLRVQMRAELQQLHRRLRTTTIYVTHDQVEAMTLGQRVAVMNKGALQQVDTPQNLYDHPANLFVAGFIGSPAMNFLNVTVRSAQHDVVLESRSFRLMAPAAHAAVLGPFADKPIVLGIRPENFKISKQQPSEGFLDIKVNVLEPLGDELLVHGEVDGQTVVAQLEPRQQVSPDQTLRLAVEMQHMHAFDPQTEQAIIQSR